RSPHTSPPPLLDPPPIYYSTGLLNNYTVTYNTAAFTINKAIASVSAVVNSKTYSNNPTTDPTLATTNSGFVPADLGATKITFSAIGTAHVCTTLPSSPRM